MTATLKEACLNLPVDFEMRMEVRKLAMICRRDGGDELARLTALFYVRLWTDWARAGMDWRALDGHAPDEGGGVRWDKESLTAILEDYCGWPDERGGLIVRCIEAGVLGLDQRAGLHGLLLKDFWRYNEHLSPGYRSMQSLGGQGKAEARRLRDLEEMAGKQARLLQGSLVFPEAKATTAAEQRIAVALVMRIDRAGGAALRATSEYSPTLVDCAVDVIRRHDKEAVTAVERYIHAHREDPSVVKLADRVVQNFDQYLERATAEKK